MDQRVTLRKSQIAALVALGRAFEDLADQPGISPESLLTGVEIRRLALQAVRAKSGPSSNQADSQSFHATPR
jgi:hypothetical protein